MYLLDSNIIIYMFNGNRNVLQNFASHSPSQIAIPSLVLYELQVGITKSSSPSRRIQQLKQLLSIIQVMPFGEAEAKEAAQIRADLERIGMGIGPIDTLIAATAIVAGSTLVTRNVKEFGRIQHLKIINWF